MHGKYQNERSGPDAAGPMKEVEMEIFSGGVQTDSTGAVRSWTELDLDTIARGYDPRIHEAPAVLGHPVHDGPAYGWVKSLMRKGGKLIARLAPTPELRELVRRGSYKKRSAAFYHPGDPHNPTPGDWYLRHVGFLGAQPPAVKGLSDVSFHESDGALVVEFDETWSQDAVDAFIHTIAGLLEDGVWTPISSSKPDPHKEKWMNFKELMKHFMNRAVDTMPETMDAVFSEEDVKKRVQAAVDEARSAMIAEFMEKEKRDSEQRKASEARSRVASFCEPLVKSGKIPPAWEKAGLRDFLETLPHEPQAALQFSETGEQQTPYEWMCSFLENLPRVVNLDEVAGRNGSNEKEAANATLSASNQLVDMAHRLSKEQNMVFSEALRSVANQHPELYEEYIEEGRGGK